MLVYINNSVPELNPVIVIHFELIRVANIINIHATLLHSVPIPFPGSYKGDC
jgi:hypothetical protein